MVAQSGASLQQATREEASLSPLQARPTKDDWPLFALLGIALLTFSAVILPYRNIEIPRLIMFVAGISLGIMLIPVVMARHLAILLLLLTYLPFNKALPGTFGRVAPAFNMTNILLLLALVGWGLFIMKNQEPVFRREKADFPLLAFMVLALLSLIRGFMLMAGRDPLDVAFSLKRWMTPMFIYFLVVNNIRTLRMAFIAFLSLCLSTSTLGVIAMKKFYIDHGVRSSIEKMRLEVTSGPNHLGFLMSTCIFLLLALWWVFRKDKRYWLLWVPILACLQTMRVTFSRGAQMGLVAGLLLFTYFSSKKLFVVLLLLVLLVATNPDIVPASLGGRMNNTVVREEGPLVERLDSSSQMRLYVWSAGTRMALNHPLIGIGYGNFKREIGQYDSYCTGVDAHNTYLIVASEMGLPAFFFFMWFFFLGFRSALVVIRKGRDDPLLYCIALGYMGMWGGVMVGNLFGTRFDSVEVAFQYFAMTAIIIACERMILDTEKRMQGEPRFLGFRLPPSLARGREGAAVDSGEPTAPPAGGVARSAREPTR